MAKVKVKQVKPKVKIIREIGKEESKSGNSPAQADNLEEEVESVPQQRIGPPIPQENFVQSVRPQVRQEAVRANTSTGPLYEVGRALGGAATGNKDKMYSTSDKVQTAGIKEAGVLLDSPRRRSGIPESQMLPDPGKMLRSDRDEKNYEPSRGGGTGQKPRRRYPWEV